MKVIIFKGYWTVSDVQNNKKYLFIFGDNDIEKGKKGQAIIRDEDNAIGIPTKKIPSYSKEAYYYDKDYDDNKYKIDFAINKILNIARNGHFDGIVLPEDGIGTGLANLNLNAPKTLEYINAKIIELKDKIKDI